MKTFTEQWPSRKRELQIVLDSKPFVKPPKLTAPRKEKGVIIELSGCDRMLLEEAGKSE